MDKSPVALANCGSYSREEAGAGLDNIISALGGFGKFLRPGMSVFVKPNLLLGAAPEKAVTTHPAVLIELINRLQDFGAEVSFGDLPGGFHVGVTARIHRETGMDVVAKETGAELVILEQHGFRDREILDGVTLKLIHTPKHLDTVDAIVNVCKVKTHMQSRFTGAVKNTFGLVTTQDRLHAHRHSKFEDFSEALVDIFSVMRPVLNFADGIVGMEGTGPSQGKPVKLNFLAASPDAVALDTVCASIMGFHPREIGTIEAARRRGLGAGRLREIELLGAPLQPLLKKVKRPSSAVFALMPFISSPMSEWSTVHPVIIKDKCKKCRTCVEVCPNDAIRTGGRHFTIDDARCLKCFCCHEMCPHDAVGLDRPLLARIADLIS